LTIRFIIVASWLALDTELRGGQCLSYVGREGYHPDSLMDMYVVRADRDEQLRESEAFDALRDKIRLLAGEVDDAATGLPP
jgi:hypothetical protein